jgi:hypothetical protein
MNNAFDELLQKYVELSNKYDTLAKKYDSLIKDQPLNKTYLQYTDTMYYPLSSIQSTGISIAMPNTTPTLTLNETITL